MPPRPPRVSPARAIALLTGAGAAGLATAAYAHAVERNWLRVSRHTVRVAHLPPAWDGIRVAQMSDFHVGAPGAPYALMRRAVARAVSLRPDLVVLTGDYTEEGNVQPLDFLAPLAGAAPTFAVLGNHDYFTGPAAAAAMADELRAAGVRVLRNEVAPFTFRGTTAPIAGFDDVYGPGPGIAAAVAVAGALWAAGGVPLALVHQPDVAEMFPPGWAGLALSGHTHSAQVRLSPFRTWDWTSLKITQMSSRYLRGLFRVNGTLLYVNAGIGTARLPVRLFARPELAVFTLRHVEREGDT